MKRQTHNADDVRRYWASVYPGEAERAGRTQRSSPARAALLACLALAPACASTDFPNLNLYSVEQDKALGSRAFEELLADSASPSAW